MGKNSLSINSYISINVNNVIYELDLGCGHRNLVGNEMFFYTNIISMGFLYFYTSLYPVKLRSAHNNSFGIELFVLKTYIHIYK